MLVQDLNQLNSVLAIAVDRTVDNLLEELKRIVKETVYGDAPLWYDRTGDFAEAWDKDATQVIGSVVRGRIFPNNQLNWEASEFQHGNIYEPVRYDGDISGLYTILDNGADNSNNKFGFQKPQPIIIGTSF